jgi:hypothetical protein
MRGVVTRLDEQEQRAARLDAIVEELRVTTEDMRELARQANARSAERLQEAKSVVAFSKALRAKLKGGKKR